MEQFNVNKLTFGRVNKESVYSIPYEYIFEDGCKHESTMPVDKEEYEKDDAEAMAKSLPLVIEEIKRSIQDRHRL